MKVLKTSCHSLGLGAEFESSVVTIGNFDGCHQGHQELIRLTCKEAAKRQVPSIVLTFDPNPKEYFQAGKSLGRLFQTEQKIRALNELGISAVVIQKFDAAFSEMSAEVFYRKLLVDFLQARVLIVGHDFRFGSQRLGNVDLLRQLAIKDEDKVVVHEVGQQIDERGEIISSSLIRRLLDERAIDRANAMLGRPYMLEGQIVVGRKLGRTLGFPTANLDLGQQLLPGMGVYAGFAKIGGTASIFKSDPDSIPCVLNIGLRPTVEAGTLKPSVEVHLLEGSYAPESLYRQILSVSITDFLRSEQKLPSLDALRAQIALDCATARRLLPASRAKWS